MLSSTALPFATCYSGESHSHAEIPPIVILTTESNEELKRRGKDAGASGWIVKPFQAEQLLKVLRLLLK